MSDLKGGTPAGWTVCGWFTEDDIYRPLAERLAASLKAVGAPYDIVAVEKRVGGWEANTVAKAEQALNAMDRHPSKTVVLMDVDFEATGDLSYLANAPGDIALRIQARRHRRRPTRLFLSSRVIVLKPTTAARRFVEKWVELSSKPESGDIDEAYLGLAADAMDGCAISNLGWQQLSSVLVHSRASDGARMNAFQYGIARVSHALRTVTRV